MKAHTQHSTSITPYEFRYDPAQRVQWQWFCDCGSTGSGFSNEADATEAALTHEETAPVMAANRPGSTPAPVPVPGVFVGRANAGW